MTSDASATKGQVISLSTLLAIADPSNVGYTALQLWDSDGTTVGGEFLINGVTQTGNHAINVPSGANVVFDAGTGSGTDTLWAQLVQDNGTLSGWQEFTVTVPQPTLTVHNDASATRGQVISLSSLLAIADPGNVGYTALQLWDSDGGTVAGGEFKINGVAQPGQQTINVSAANVANTVFDAGTLGGSDTLWAQLLESNGTLSGWQEFTVTAPAATLPTLTVTSDASATKGQVISLSTLLAIADPSNVGYTALQLWDSDGTVAGGEFKINGVAQSANHAINVASGANVVFDAGTSAGTDTLWAQLVQDNGTLSGWQEFTVTVPQPTLTVTSDASATKGQVISLSSLLTIADPGNVGYTTLQLWDSDGGTVAGGEFKINGVAQPGQQTINVSAANVANVVFDAGTSAGTDTLWAQLVQDNGTLSGWQEFTVTVPQPTLTVTSDASATRGQVISLSSLLAIADPGNVGYTTLQLWDSDGGTVAGGEFVVNGVAQPGQQTINVSAANVANTVFDVGILGGSDTLWAQLVQDNGTLSGWQEFTVTAPAATLPTLTLTSDASATKGQVISLSTLLAIADPSNVGYTALQLAISTARWRAENSWSTAWRRAPITPSTSHRAPMWCSMPAHRPVPTRCGRNWCRTTAR